MGGPIVVKIQLLDPEGDEYEVAFPAVFEVCPTCEGKGTHVNPAIDGDGITSEEWERDWGSDEREAYFAGAYDVSCEECHGQRVVPVINEEAAKAQGLGEELAQYHEQIREEDEYQRTCAAERRMGA